MASAFLYARITDNKRLGVSLSEYLKYSPLAFTPEINLSGVRTN